MSDTPLPWRGRRHVPAASCTSARRTWPCPRCGPCTPPATTSRWSCRGADKRRGRGGALVPSPVKQAALDLGLPVSATVEDALDAGADLGVVAAFGRIIRRPVLERLAMVNLHFSLLPRWRGAAPVERAILAGDERTGVDLMAVEEGLDTGGVYGEVGPRHRSRRDRRRAA